MKRPDARFVRERALEAALHHADRHATHGGKYPDALGVVRNAALFEEYLDGGQQPTG